MSGSFLYPRLVDLYRPGTTAAAQGVQPVQQEDRLDLVPILKRIPCTIQYNRAYGNMLGGLPTDIRRASGWIVTIQSGAVGPSPAFFLNRDELVDDIGRRFQIQSAEPLPTTGWTLNCEMLEA